MGTLGKDNFEQLQHYYNSIFESNKFKHIFIIGDFTIDTINWDHYCTSDSTHTLFLDLFRNLGLSQLIHTSTHKHNKILDILLTDSPNMLDSLCIHEPGSFLNSDHSPITFTIKSVIRISKPIKRAIYNYKKANWNALNNDLSRIDWEFLLRNTQVLLFVLFINSMQDCISTGTNIALYADDTKIWRYIHSPIDHQILQNDIDALYDWSIKNKMRFNTKKCKVLSINHFNKNLFSELPFFLFFIVLIQHC